MPGWRNKKVQRDLKKYRDPIEKIPKTLGNNSKRKSRGNSKKRRYDVKNRSPRQDKSKRRDFNRRSPQENFNRPAFDDKPKNQQTKEDEYYDSLNIKPQVFYPHDWYPETRKMNRNFYFHMGPTNSGKTYAAIEALKKAGKGIYCAPLRLLAWEVAEKLNSEGIRCSLRTGQEKSISEFDTHNACTIEMANAREEYDVAVIDEIQMIADDQRGSAWTNAVLGLRAKEIHLCGDQRSLKLISDLLKVTGDNLKRREYKRMSVLRADQKPIRSFHDLRPGDCIVGFSKKVLFQMKSSINEKLDPDYDKNMKKIKKGMNNTKRHRKIMYKLKEKYLKDNPLKNKCAVIYGTLPPETKKLQAKAFNERDSGLDFLVATNAVGMGLNLNINRIIFTSIEKRIFGKINPLEKTEILQIAGRAGRFHKDGYVSAFTTKTLNKIRNVIQEDQKLSKSIGEKPEDIKKELSKENKIEINIDKYQNEDSEDEHDEGFITITDTNEDEKEESEYLFEQIKDDDYIEDNDFTKHQSMIKAAGFFPSFEQLEIFAYKIIQDYKIALPFSRILDLFLNNSELDDLYFMTNVTVPQEICRRLDKYDNSTAMRLHNTTEFLLDTYAGHKGIRRAIYNFSQCPIKLDYKNGQKRLKILEQFFMELTYFKQVRLPGKNLNDYSILSKGDYTVEDLLQLEEIHNMLEVYLWLGNKYEQEFIEITEAKLLIKHVCKLIDGALKEMYSTGQKKVKIG
ncbi:unnamed protein product [Moneuplotes crassus]|uniref:RNA helicase n=1 Tax=Euplotes crassus TaxID=5936 RepID=A0AAD1Y601_EUPCR|nr:unnamed protein product [Moneuplotes crassus]